MAYDFPNAPSIGQVANGYVWDGEKWKASNSTGPVVATKKNYIINSAMMINQEFPGQFIATSGQYALDCWTASIVTAGTIKFEQISSPSLAGSPNRLRATVLTADASVGATDGVFIRQTIEGLRFADLQAGSAAAKTVTVQFGVKAPAGVYCLTFYNAAANRTYAAEYTVASGEANTDVTKSITLTLDTTGTWAKDNTAGITLNFGLMCGSTYHGAANVWGATQIFGTANQFNFMGTNGNVFELFDVSLTEGPVAPPFQVPDYASELALCKRYWQRYINLVVDTGAVSQSLIFSVEFRALPTVTGGGAGFTTPGLTVASTQFSQTARAYQTLSINARL